MAGSPGAGKTETSKRLLENFKLKPVRIDADEIREMFEGYDGKNSYVFQKAANKGVNFLYDYSLKNKYNIIMDGTFSYGDVSLNVSRAIKRGYKVVIFFIYQNPFRSWFFTKEREKIENRHVSKSVFIKSFIKSKENVDRIKIEFGSQVEVFLLEKDFETDLEKLRININKIDNYLKKYYNEEDLNNLID